MKSKFTKIFFVISFILFSLIIYINLNSYPNGFTGVTRKTGGVGCVCHYPDSTSSVMVRISGPDSVETGQTIYYRVKITGGPAVTGGFDLASQIIGTIDTTSLDPGVKKDEVSGELTQVSPRSFSNDTVSWIFKYRAPLSAGYDTLYATGNSTNNNALADTTDRWNHSPDKIIRIYVPFGIKPISEAASTFRLFQNYPNPFNPYSKIKIELSAAGDVKLIVYDATGREIKTLVDTHLNSGTYEIEFDGKDLSSGVYFYKLLVSKEREYFTATKSMIIIK